MSGFRDGAPARCSMGPKLSLERVFFSIKSPFLRGIEWYILGLHVTKVAVISGWNDSHGSMGPEGHARRLDLVMEAMTGAKWVQNDRSLAPFFSLKSPFLRRIGRYVLSLQ